VTTTTTMMMMMIIIIIIINFNSVTAPQWAGSSSFTRSLDHTQGRTALSRTPLDEWSARRRYLYLTTLNTHKQSDIHVPRRDSNSQPQQAGGRAVTWTGSYRFYLIKLSYRIFSTFLHSVLYTKMQHATCVNVMLYFLLPDVTETTTIYFCLKTVPWLYLPPSSAEVKNEWSCTSATSVRLHGVDR